MLLRLIRTTPFPRLRSLSPFLSLSRSLCNRVSPSAMPETIRRKRSKPSIKGGIGPTRMENQPSQNQSEDVWSRPNWPPRIEKIFVELLVEEMKYHPDVCVTGFNEEAWDNVCKEFNKETNLNFDKMELKKHLAVLKKRYRIVKPLYNHGGFGWNHRLKRVEVDDAVWEEYIEAYPEIKPYRKWGCPLYEELCMIFTKPIATGEFAMAIGGGNIFCSRGNRNTADGRNKRQLVQPSSSGPNNRTHKDSANLKADAVVETGSASKLKGTASGQNDDLHSAGDCITIINGMQGVDRRLYNASIDLLQNANWRKTFISLKSEKRLSWLKAMLPSVY